MMMKSGKSIPTILLAVMACLLLLGSAGASEGDAEKVYRIGVSYSTIGDMNPNDAAAALKAWAAAMPKDYSLDFYIDIKLDTYTTEDLKASYDRNELDGVWITVSELVEMGLKPTAVFSGDRGGDGPEVTYAIVVHKQGKVTSSADLADCKLAVTRGSEHMTLTIPWLETVLVQAETEKGSRKYESPLSVEKPSKAIFQVFFHQVDAAVVTRESFELACELNPQLGRDLEVLAESPPFITSIFMFRPSLYEDPNMEDVEKAVLGIHKTTGGKQLLNILKSNRMEKSPPSIMDETIRFLEKHDSMIKESIFLEEMS